MRRRVVLWGMVAVGVVELLVGHGEGGSQYVLVDAHIYIHAHVLGR